MEQEGIEEKLNSSQGLLVAMLPALSLLYNFFWVFFLCSYIS